MFDQDKYCPAVLRSRIDLSDDLAIFHFEPEDDLEFIPGQYATIGLPSEDSPRPLLRPYSVVSAPHQDTIEVFVEQADDGTFTPHLWKLSTGDQALIRRRIVGRFTLDARAQRHLMLATVTGVGPYVSIIRDVLRRIDAEADYTPPELLVMHGASHQGEHGPYLDELSDLAASHSWLTYIPTISRPWDSPDWSGELGRVEDILRKVADCRGFIREDTTAYTCGHPGMIRKAKGILIRAGFDEDHIRKEHYFRE